MAASSGHAEVASKDNRASKSMTGNRDKTGKIISSGSHRFHDHDGRQENNETTSKQRQLRSTSGSSHIVKNERTNQKYKDTIHNPPDRTCSRESVNKNVNNIDQFGDHEYYRSNDRQSIPKKKVPGKDTNNKDSITLMNQKSNLHSIPENRRTRESLVHSGESHPSRLKSSDLKSLESTNSEPYYNFQSEKVEAEGDNGLEIIQKDDLYSKHDNSRAGVIARVNKILDLLLSVRHGKPGRAVRLSYSSIEFLINESISIIESQSALLELEAPICIVGDIHAQYYDLLRIFEVCGFPTDTNYLFLGDYVDRGKQGIETMSLLMCYKIKYPENFFLLRGNHESAQVARIYGFFDECNVRTKPSAWNLFVKLFNMLPLAAIVDEKIFCVHAGISPSLATTDMRYPIDMIRSWVRPCEIPDCGLWCDLLWSDPEKEILGWAQNDRGVSFTFGEGEVEKFLKRHNFDIIVRGHQVVSDGYQFFGGRRCVTIFSAPNYCGTFDNCGAVMLVSKDLQCSFRVLRPL